MTYDLRPELELESEMESKLELWNLHSKYSLLASKFRLLYPHFMAFVTQT